MLELEGVAVMLADTFKMDHAASMKNLHDMREANPWLSPLVTIFENQENWKEMVQQGGAQVTLCGGVVRSRKTVGDNSLPSLRPQVLRVNLPDACIWDNLDPRWGAGIPNRFQFLQFAEGQYRLAHRQTPQEEYEQGLSMADDFDDRDIFYSPELSEG